MLLDLKNLLSAGLLSQVPPQVPSRARIGWSPKGRVPDDGNIPKSTQSDHLPWKVLEMQLGARPNEMKVNYYL